MRCELELRGPFSAALFEGSIVEVNCVSYLTEARFLASQLRKTFERLSAICCLLSDYFGSEPQASYRGPAIISAYNIGSTFAPDTTTTVSPCLSAGGATPANSAAKATAPPGSMTSFIFEKPNRIAART